MVPFYCVVQKVCMKCEDIDFKKGEKNEVECCGVREIGFEGTIDEPVVDALYYVSLLFHKKILFGLHMMVVVLTQFLFLNFC